MDKQYLTIQEASIATWKHINTIRLLIQNNKIQYTKENKRYLISKEVLALYYKDLKDQIMSFWEENKQTSSNDVTTSSVNNLLQEQLKPLIDWLKYYTEQYQNTQKLLTSSEHEKMELEKQYQYKLDSQKKSFELLVNKKTIIVKILGAVIIVLFLLMLMQWWIIKVNI